MACMGKFFCATHSRLTTTPIASACPSAMGRIAASVARRLFSCIPSATAKSHPIIYCGVKGVGKVDAAPITAHLDHLRGAVQRRSGILRVWSAPHNATNSHRAVSLGLVGSETSYCRISPDPQQET